jgi:glycosyltransferase involved in cell wall biosynthesis
MKVAHFVPSVLPAPAYGGTERVVYWMCEEQAKAGLQVTLLSREGSRMPFGSWVLMPETKDEWAQVLSRGGFDLVHFHSLPPPTFPKDHPHVVTIHGNGKEGEVFPRNSVFVSRDHAARHGSRSFVHNGLKLDLYPMKSSRERTRDTLFLAKASWRVKNLKGSIEIARRARHRLLVAGGRRPLRPWGLFAFNARFFGNVRDEQKIELLHRSDALVFPVLWHEPFGIAVIEALACGVPVIGTPYGALPEIVSPECGLLDASVETLADALATKLGGFRPEACRARVEKHFTAEQMARSYVEIYERVLRGEAINDADPRTLRGPLAGIPDPKNGSSSSR